ncbi:MAG: RNA polymerase sigma factor [Pseudomonadales bacterium]
MTGISQTELPVQVAKGVIRGDDAALADAYRVLAQPVMNLATRILKDRQLAEEVVQDTFIDLVEKSSQIRESQAIAGWVRTVATNHCLMRLRSPWHAKRVNLEADEFDQSRTDGDERSTTPDHSAEDTIEKAFGQLSVETRAVVWLHDVEGYTHKEIGELMGKTTSFSKSQLARGYEKLLSWRENQVRAQSMSQGLDHTINEKRDVAIDTGYIKPTCAS